MTHVYSNGVSSKVEVAINNCYNEELAYLQIRKSFPSYLEDAKKYFYDIEGGKLCERAFSQEDEQEEEEDDGDDDIENCKSILGGLLLKGISNTLHYIYSHLSMENLMFKSAKVLGKSDEQYLRNLIDIELARDVIDTIQKILDPLFE